MRNMWKWIGLAGLVGVAAGGVLVAAISVGATPTRPTKFAVRLHQRLAETNGSSSS